MTAMSDGAGNEPQPEDDDEVIRSFIHDIRNPIGAIVGFADLLKSREGRMSEDQRRKVIDSLHRTAERLSDMVSQFSAERRAQREDK